MSLAPGCVRVPVRQLEDYGLVAQPLVASDVGVESTPCGPTTSVEVQNRHALYSKFGMLSKFDVVHLLPGGIKRNATRHCGRLLGGEEIGFTPPISW
jgi:hypothetical protein